MFPASTPRPLQLFGFTRVTLFIWNQFLADFSGSPGENGFSITLCKAVDAFFATAILDLTETTALLGFVW